MALTTLTKIGKGITSLFKLKGATHPRSLLDRLEKLVDPRDYGANSEGVLNDTATLQDYSTKLLGKSTYKVSINPESLSSSNFNDCVLEKGKIKYFSKGYFNESTGKISNGMLYTAWAQDSAYTLNNQIRVWVSQKYSHTDASSVPVCLYSDDNGSSYSTYIIDERLKTHSVWSAGVANGKEYVIIRDDSTSPNFKHYAYSRSIPSGGAAQYFNHWSKKELVLPTPPVGGIGTTMIHSFTEGADGSIVMCAHNGAGAWLLRSNNDMNTFTAHSLLVSASAEEGTVKYHNGNYFGFLRNGGGGNPRYWYSDGLNLDSITIYTAPADSFGSQLLEDCPVPLQIDDNGKIHAFVAYRNGTLEGLSDDHTASMFYITGTASKSNFWETAGIYNLGVAYHAETNGASALGVGSIIIHNNNLHIYGGSEGRSGLADSRDRIADIYQWVIPLRKSWGAFDYRQQIANNNVASFQVSRLSGYDKYSVNARYILQKNETVSTAYSNVHTSFRGYCVDTFNVSGGYCIATDALYGFYYTYGSNAEPRGLRIEANTPAANMSLMVDGAEKVRLWDGNRKSLNPLENDISCGNASHKWTDIYSVNSIINTSDERLKSNKKPLPISFVNPLCQLAREIQQFTWNDAVTIKDENARIHVGVMAQRVYSELATVTDDPFAYGILCKDYLFDEKIIEDAQGNQKTIQVPRLIEGQQEYVLGLRHSELHYAILWAQQMKIDSIIN